MAKKILIVDDSSTTRGMIKRIIHMTGLPVDPPFEAEHGAAALAFLATTHVDLVMADLNMPVMDGHEMIARIRADALLCDIPIVVISAQPDPARVAELTRAGIRGYIPKPFTPETVRNLIGPIFQETAGVSHD